MVHGFPAHRAPVRTCEARFCTPRAELHGLRDLRRELARVTCMQVRAFRTYWAFSVRTYLLDQQPGFGYALLGGGVRRSLEHHLGGELLAPALIVHQMRHGLPVQRLLAPGSARRVDGALAPPPTSCPEEEFDAPEEAIDGETVQVTALNVAEPIGDQEGFDVPEEVPCCCEPSGVVAKRRRSMWRP